VFLLSGCRDGAASRRPREPAIPGAEALGIFLAEAGFEIEAQYGDWLREPVTAASREIITIARRR
jgi:hypothetical protein